VDSESSAHDASKAAKSSSHFPLRFPPVPGITDSSCALLGPGLHWGDTGDLSPPGQSSCATAGACLGCDGVTLTSSGFQSRNPAHPPGQRSRAEQEAPPALSEGHLPSVQPTAFPQRGKRYRQPSPLRGTLLITSSLGNYLVTIVFSTGCWVLALMVLVPGRWPCPGSPYMPEGCFSMASLGQRPVQPPVPGNAPQHYRNR